MKIGLLECDHVREELRHIAGDYRNIFPALFLQVAPLWEFTFYDVVNGQFPEKITECDAYICTGSSFSVYDQEPWVLQLKQFVVSISESDRKFIGICFGHQMMGEALGGKVQKSEVGWCVGSHTFQVLQVESWMVPFRNAFNLLMMCQDQILTLPENTKLLAQSHDCPYAMIQIGNNMLGIQAHPEFPKKYDQALMELRKERIGANKVEMGIISLKLPTHELTFANWIKNFVEISL
tara:strand:+ start:1160 stop:1867 length:708 start_codon:yes stop_codon:yes gene_type:complete